MTFIYELDPPNHQYVISIKRTNITRYIDYKIASDDYFDEIESEMIIEYRQLKINEILK